MFDIIEKSFENQVQDLQELIRIPSVNRTLDPASSEYNVIRPGL